MTKNNYMGKIDEDYSETIVPNYDKPVTFTGKKLDEFEDKYFVKSGELSIVSFVDIKVFICQVLQEQREEIIKCLPGTVVLDQDFYSEENQKSVEFNRWYGADEYRQQFLNNLKDAGLN